MLLFYFSSDQASLCLRSIVGEMGIIIVLTS